jgi:hypothetical protein
MNHLKVYESLVKKFLNNPPSGYSEKHHIVPRCLGGSNEKNNIVRLPARYHFVAHILLAKIHGGSLIHAAWMMSNNRHYNSKKYSWLREQAAINSSLLNRGRKQTEDAKIKQIKAQSGKNNHFFGKKHSKKSLLKMSESHSGERHNMFGKKQSEFTKKKRSATMTGMKKTDEHRRNLSISRIGIVSPMKGKKHSPESIEKMRLAKIGNIPWNKGRKKV